MIGWPFEAVLDEQFVERVGGDVGFVGQHLGRGRRRGDPEDRSALGAELVDAGSSGDGLAGAGGALHQDQASRTGQRGCGFPLGASEMLGCPGEHFGAVGAAHAHALFGPGEQTLLFGKDVRRRQCSVGDGLGDRPAVDPSTSTFRYGL